MLRVPVTYRLNFTGSTTLTFITDTSGKCVTIVHRPHVLITRPSGQHEQFAQACKALGFQVSHLPALAIDSLQNATLDSKALADADSILFTSTNAVEYAHALLPMPWPGVKVRAIGSATANALLQRGQTLVSPPSPPYTSDAFLTQLISNAPEKLIIIKGRGGRTLIRDALIERGWQVQSIDVYQRVLPTISSTLVDTIFQHPEPAIITITSNETLNNLMTLVGHHRSALLGIQLVVNSDRGAELAENLGFQHAALVALPAGDKGQLMQLKHWLANSAGNPST